MSEAAGMNRADYLRKLWSELLGVESVRTDDRFDALGGDSMLLIEMLERVTRDCPTPIDYESFLLAPTIDTLASLMNDGLANTRPHHDA